MKNAVQDRYRSLIAPRLGAIAIALLTVVMAGCATSSTFRTGAELLEQGSEVEAVLNFEKATQENPTNVEYRLTYLRVRDQAVARLIENAWSTSIDHQKPVEGKRLLEKARLVASSDVPLNNKISKVERRIAQEAELARALEASNRGDFALAAQILKPLLRADGGNARAQELMRTVESRNAKAVSETSTGSGKLSKTISLEFRDTPARSVLEAVAAKAGISLAFDAQTKADARITIMLKAVTVDAAIQSILASGQLARRKMGPDTFLIYAATPEKLKEHQQLFTRTFYIAHADPRQTENLVRQFGKVQDVFVDDKEGLLVVRGTPEVLAMVEKLVAIHNRPRPEVILDVEVLEIGTNALSDIGIKWPDRLSATLRPSAGAGGSSGNSGGVTFPVDQLREINSGFATVTVPSPLLAATLRQTGGNASILANPQIRVRQREKANILIGDRVPVVTTTTTATGFVAESVNYLDVGIKLDVEPEIYANDEVAVNISLEVSNIAGEIRTASGSIAYQVGTRAASTVLQLRDGETQILAGLISDESRRSANEVPVLGKIPILGRLFSQRNDSRLKTEVVLLITPRIVRSHSASGPSSEMFASGSATSVRLPDYGRFSRQQEATTQSSFNSNASALIQSNASRKTTVSQSVQPISDPQSGTVRGNQQTSVSAPSREPNTSAEGQVRLSVKSPPPMRIGREATIALQLDRASAAVGTGSLQVNFDADRFTAGFASNVRGIGAAIDNGIGQIRLRINPSSPVEAGSEIGRIKLTPIGARTGPSALEIGSGEMRSVGGDELAVVPNLMRVPVDVQN